MMLINYNKRRIRLKQKLKFWMTRSMDLQLRLTNIQHKIPIITISWLNWIKILTILETNYRSSKDFLMMHITMETLLMMLFDWLNKILMLLLPDITVRRRLNKLLFWTLKLLGLKVNKLMLLPMLSLEMVLEFFHLLQPLLIQVLPVQIMNQSALRAGLTLFLLVMELASNHYLLVILKLSTHSDFQAKPQLMLLLPPLLMHLVLVNVL